jgi:hypothetical protein
MPLIDKLNDTALRSLKYEKDLPGGGSSGLPYIKTDINTIDEGFNRFRLTKFDDGFTRGGTVGALNAAVTDTIRIGKMLTDLPKGPLFLAKQVGLQLSNPRIETKQIPKINGISALNYFSLSSSEAKIGPTRIYNLGVNTLAQVPINAFGGHIVRHGLTPIQNEQTKYETVVRDNDKLKSSKLLRLTQDININNPDNQNTKINRSNLISSELSKSTLFYNPSYILNILNNDRPQTIERYIGGPDSTYGIGFTTIRRTSYTGYDNEGKILSNKQPYSEQGKINYYNLQGASKIYFETNVNNNASPLSDNFGMQILSNITSNISTIYAENNINIAQPTNKPTQIDQGKQIAPNKQLYPGQYKINYYNLQGVSKEYLETNVNNNTSPLADNFGMQILSNTINTISNIIAISDENNISTTQPTNKPTQIDQGKQTSYANLKTEIENVVFNNKNRPKVTAGNYTANEFNIINELTVAKNKDGTYTKNINGLLSYKSDTNKIAYSNKIDSPVIINYSWKQADRAVRVGSGRQDTINLTPLFTADNGQDSLAVKIGDKPDYTINDLVKFRIEAIDTDAPDKSTFMIFRAYLTNLSDASSPKWSTINYIGRGEDFYIYTGFSRKINIGFKVAALSAKEMEPMYQKLNYLMSNTMPDYSNAGLMRGPFMRMTVGNWIDSQPGIMNDLTYTVNNDSPWEIAINEPLPGGSKELILPHIVEVSMTFTPIGTQHQKNNLVSKKSAQQSNIAQNYNGASPQEYNYIKKDYEIKTGTPVTPKV